MPEKRANGISVADLVLARTVEAANAVRERTWLRALVCLFLPAVLWLAGGLFLMAVVLSFSVWMATR